MQPVVGIDLGTSHCKVAWLRTPGDAQILLNGDNERLTPTVLAVRADGGVLVGQSAVEQEWRYPERVARDIVLHLESGEPILLDGKSFAPETLVASLLAHLKSDAETRLNETVDRAIVAIPAGWGAEVVNRLSSAGHQAGINIVSVPSAIAAILAAGRPHSSVAQEHLLIYDLGGSRFDATLVDVVSDGLRILQNASLREIGGKAFDQKIIDHVLSITRQKYPDADHTGLKFLADLRIRAEQAKIRLTMDRVADIILYDALRTPDGTSIDIDPEITREDFNQMIEADVRQTIELTRRVLSEGNLMPADVDAVLMLGGTSRVPLVRMSMDILFGGSARIQYVDPVESVARGAAMYAEYSPQYEATKVLNIYKSDSGFTSGPVQEPNFTDVVLLSKTDPKSVAGQENGVVSDPPENMILTSVEDGTNNNAIQRLEDAEQHDTEARDEDPELVSSVHVGPVESDDKDAPDSDGVNETESTSGAPMVEVENEDVASDSCDATIVPGSDESPHDREESKNEAPQSAPEREDQYEQGTLAEVNLPFTPELSEPLVASPKVAGERVDLQIECQREERIAHRYKFPSRVFVRISNGVFNLATPSEAEGEIVDQTCLHLGSPVPEIIECSLFLIQEGQEVEQASLSLPLPSGLQEGTPLYVFLKMDYATGRPSVMLRWQASGTDELSTVSFDDWRRKADASLVFTENAKPAEAKNMIGMDGAGSDGPARINSPAENTIYCGSYVVGECREEGRLYTVYPSNLPQTGTPCLLKVFPSNNENAKHLFLSSLLPINILHPNIARVYDFGQSELGYYVVHEYVENTLRDWMIQKGSPRPLPTEEVLPIMIQVCDGLDALHKQRISHRNLKPSNIIVNGAEEIAKLTDFELCVSLRGVEWVNEVAGTLPYIAKEVLERHADHRADIYAVGVLLFELLTGSLPFTATNQRLLVDQIIAQTPPDPRSLNPEISDHMSSVILCALAKDVTRRFQHAAELREALSQESDAVFRTMTSHTNPPAIQQ